MDEISKAVESQKRMLKRFGRKLKLKVTDQAGFDLVSLCIALESQRDARGIVSWREMARQIGVSPSSLSRINHGKRPDVDTLTAVIRWLGISADNFMPVNGDKCHPLAAVSPLLHGRKMSPNVVRALDELMRAAYKLVKAIDNA